MQREKRSSGLTLGVQLRAIDHEGALNDARRRLGSQREINHSSSLTFALVSCSGLVRWRLVRPMPNVRSHRKVQPIRVAFEKNQLARLHVVTEMANANDQER